MKKIAVLLLGALLCGCSGAPKPYSLTGRIAHADSDVLLIGTRFNQMDTVRLAPDGTFSYTHAFAEPAFGFAYLPDRAFYALVFIDGTSSHLEADADTPTEYRVTGDLEAAQTFHLATMQQLSALAEKEYASFGDMQATFDRVSDSLYRVLETVKPAPFRAIERAGIEASVGNSLVAYHQTFRERNLPPDSDADYNRYMEHLELTADNAITYLYWKEACAGGETSPSYLRMVQTADRRIADPQLKQKIVLEVMSNCFSEGGADMEAAYRAALPLVRDEKPAAWLTKTYEANKYLIPGAQALDCDLEDPQGRMSRLSDLYGKYLYVDIWATWCGPCCEEIPHLERLVEAYRNDPRIEFVSITVDENRDAWLKKLAADKPRWRQMRNADFCTLYGISGIPCFLMISPEGKIVTVHAPRPSAPEVKEFINRTLDR